MARKITMQIGYLVIASSLLVLSIFVLELVKLVFGILLLKRAGISINLNKLRHIHFYSQQVIDCNQSTNQTLKHARLIKKISTTLTMGYWLCVCFIFLFILSEFLRKY
jgi:hypothetical protein